MLGQIRSAPILRQLLIGIIIGAALTAIVLAGFPDDSLPRSTDNASSSVIDPGEAIAAGRVAPAVGQPAPHFSLPDVEGQNHQLQDFEGKIVLLNFWATWCAPCRLEMPLLEKHSQEIAGGEFVILAINLQESIDQVQEFVDEMGLSMPVLLDLDGKVSQQYHIIGYPSSILIDRNGTIQAIHIGIISEPQLHQYLETVGFSL